MKMEQLCSIIDVIADRTMPYLKKQKLRRYTTQEELHLFF